MADPTTDAAPTPDDSQGLSAALARSSDAFGNLSMSSDQLASLKADLGDSQNAEDALTGAEIKNDSAQFQGKAPEQDAHLLSGLMPLLAIGAFAGKATKLNASAMLGASIGMTDGYLNGKQQVYEENKKKYEEAYQQFKDRQAEQDKIYKEMREAYKGRIDADIKALEFARQVTQDQAANQATLLRDHEIVKQHAAELEKIQQRLDETKYEDHVKNYFEQQKIDLAKANAAPPSKDASQGAVGMVLSGAPLNQVVPGYGKGASAQRAQVRDAAIAQIKADYPDMTDIQAGQELARRQVEYTAGKASTTQLTKMLGATRQALSQLDFNVDKATEEMKKLPSADLAPVLNAIARGAEKWDGDPAYAGLFFYMTGAATESARLKSGGQASSAQLHAGAAEEAKEWANVNMTPASWAEVSKAMKAEGQNKLDTYQQAIAAGEKAPVTPGGNSDGPNPSRIIKVDENGVPIE